jgi:S-adenosylmethionine:tRNA ribosyltransferase-isomerase
MTAPFSLSTYRFDLPEELIAQAPVSPRDSSRLLVLDRAQGRWEHRQFKDLPSYFGEGDTLVANNSRVIPARLLGTRRGLPGKVEFLLLEQREPFVWEGLMRSSATQKAGLEFEILKDGTSLDPPLIGEILRPASESPAGTTLARFSHDPLKSGAGALPLPPYIQKKPDASDQKSYQTIYAKTEGSAAAPTAGFHFTPEILGALKARGAQWEEITLHVGLGTFRPVKSDDIRQHVMHEERFTIAPDVQQRLKQTLNSQGRITAVGTTSLRALESPWESGRTSIFIYPNGRKIEKVSRLITNFHLPESTLLMLVCAFAGTELVLEAYREAVRERYRFFSYGDAMIIL